MFAREGAQLVIAEIARADGEATAAAIKEAGGQARFVATDVTVPAQVEAAVRAAVDAFGGLHVLYNNAGGATPKDGKVTDMDLDEFWRTIGVDLFGTFLGCRFAIPVMVAGGGGSIINTTSIRAMIGTAGADAYSAAKGGVRALTQALALQWAAHNIRVNAIAPGVILTERVKALLREDDPIYQEVAARRERSGGRGADGAVPRLGRITPGDRRDPADGFRRQRDLTDPPRRDLTMQPSHLVRRDASARSAWTALRVARQIVGDIEPADPARGPDVIVRADRLRIVEAR